MIIFFYLNAHRLYFSFSSQPIWIINANMASASKNQFLALLRWVRWISSNWLASLIRYSRHYFNFSSFVFHSLLTWQIINKRSLYLLNLPFLTWPQTHEYCSLVSEMSTTPTSLPQVFLSRQSIGSAYLYLNSLSFKGL
jgi:hypothetical protein